MGAPLAVGGHRIEVAGLQTFYLQAGTGHPVLLIHGAAPGACSSVSWKLNIKPLAHAGLAVFAFDQPGFGHTENPPEYSVEFRLAHARAFATALGLERFHVVGSSVGAYIAARLALEDPRTRRVVLVSSSTLAPRGSAAASAMAERHAEELATFSPSLENVREMTRKTLYRSDLVTEDLVRERYEMASGRLYEAILERRRAPRPRPIIDELPNLHHETLIIWGRDDCGAAVERALLLYQLLPRAQLHIFSECAHWAQWDQAARFNRLVADFLLEADAP